MAGSAANSPENSAPPIEVVPPASSGERQADSSGTAWDIVLKILRPMASLKLTVVLLACAIFIVVAGTFAQAKKGIWQVVDDYFRIDFEQAARESAGGPKEFVQAWTTASLARIELGIFLPDAFTRGTFLAPKNDKDESKPDGEQKDEDPYWFPFPKGWLIGLLMSINLLSAHIIRFKVQARGVRLGWGLGTLLAGFLVTFLVIQSGSNADGIQQSVFAMGEDGSWLSWESFWRLLMVGIALAFLSALYGAIMTETLSRKSRIGFGVLAAAIGILLAWLLYQGSDARLGEPSLRILWQLIKATFAGCVLLVGCILLFRKRGGVVLLHGGIGLMMLSELLVGTTAKEARMSMGEKETVNYVFDIRALELAVIKHGAKEDQVAVVTDAEIRSHLPIGEDPGETIRADELPFDLRIVKYYPNSTLDLARVDDELIATSGTGTLFVAIPLRQSTGVDNDSSVDLPAAYVEVLDKQSGQPIGTYLTTVVAQPQVVRHEGQRYDIALRFEREYLPYKVTLEKAQREYYIGTSQVKNYSSDILLRDGDKEIQHHIWMNNPLRYRNRTFYQSGFNTSADGSAISTLQVVTNSGWMLPYVSCMIVAVGLLAHFTVILVRYLQRQHRERQASKDTAGDVGRAERRRQERKPGGKDQDLPLAPDTWTARLFQGTRSEIFARWFPFGVVAICAIWVSSTMRQPGLPDDGMDLQAFGKLPVVYEGRVKPFDTLARTSLRRLSAKQTFYNEEDEKTAAIRWLLDLMSQRPKLDNNGRPEFKDDAPVPIAATYEIIRIDNPDVVELLGLKWVKRHSYSPQAVRDALASPTVQISLQDIGKSDPEETTVTLQKLNAVSDVMNHLDLLIAAFTPFLDQENYELNPQRWPATVRDAENQLNKFQAPFAIPVDINAGNWRPFSTASADLVIARNTGRISSGADATKAMERILTAYREGRPKDFNKAVADYRQSLIASAASFDAEKATVEYDQAKHDFETSFNQAEPFYYYLVLYVIAGLLAVFAWLGWSEPLNRASLWLLCFTFGLHTLALIARIYISGRPPVTNLYTTGIFVSWGCVLMGLILERWSKLGLGNVIAAVCGFGGLLIAHLLTTSVANFRGDTFTVMQAVLDTQFWLATHVVIINMGYAATDLAGGFGILYILLGICTPRLSKRVDQHLVRMMYGTLCFAIFFSFVGTVLGGLWADDSWGRFWGWDPKENGALIIVLWNAIVLHARWDGLVKDRGLAVLCVLGNICVTWSWFMVNELGVGLHAYGFTEGVLAACLWVIVTHLLIAALGTFWPKDAWWSIKARQSA